MLYCLGNNDKENVCTCSVQPQFFWKDIFNVGLVESANAEPVILGVEVTANIK
jgi:hypothetical protein